jgi:sucrose-6-phosphate hydrolase SacC (GH32 family)
VWSLNEDESRFAHAESDDLISWRRQSYPDIKEGNFLDPIVSFNPNSNNYSVLFKSGDQLKKVTTSDFKTYTEEILIAQSDYKDPRKSFEIDGWKVDYEAMKESMIYGKKPSFEKLLIAISELQDRFRSAKR